MSTQTPTAYIVTPISTPPEENGEYYVMNDGLAVKMQYGIIVKSWIDNYGNQVKPDPDKNVWLRPVDLSRMLEEAWEAGAQSESNCIKPEGDCGYDATQHEVDKINYLKSVLNPPK